MNYSIHYPLFRISLICLLWVIFGRTPLDAQNKDTLLNFSIRNAALDKFAKQLEDSTGFSFIYGEKIQLKKPVTLDMTQSPITDILHLALGSRGRRLQQNTRSRTVRPKLRLTKVQVL